MSAKAKTVKARKISTRVVLATVVTIIALTITTVGLLSISQIIPSTGNITTVNIGVYSDSACTQNLTSINWGQISPGNNSLTTIYVKNTGNAPITLSMTTNNWNPSTASSYIAVTWDKAGASLPVGASTAAVLTLTVSPSINGITSFSVNILIAGSA